MREAVAMTRSPPLWVDREDAGRKLARRFSDRIGDPQAVLVALPRGGVAVAAPMAEILRLPLVSWAVRKIAHPTAPEFAIGALAPGEVILWDQDDGGARLGQEERRHLVRLQQEELRRRQQRFGDPFPDRLSDRHLIVVDDGIATGMTVRAALASLRQLQPASLALAVPVVDGRLLPDLKPLVDRFEALAIVRQLRAVGEWYEWFDQVEDEEVNRLLHRHRQPITEMR